MPVRRGSTDVDIVAATAASIVFVASALAFGRRTGPREVRWFAIVNEWPDTRLVRLPQQLGTPWMLPLTGAALWASGRRREGVATAAALPVSKDIEVAVKKLLQRPRPLYETPTILRDDAPLEGPSFPSGHAAIATATAYMIAREVPAAAAPLAALTIVASLVRVHQGAHWLSDAVGGGALGIAVAAAARTIALRIPIKA
ncbi:phosphatase PAP2 family protein [Aeromicrobium sp.]|uniref:phosphatase PAP2 family protein n=1 Tax=Aeromicrobium sp. TaxID=1871063 RepID=UPI0028A58878|nr:phosphatase PAP2 family protein [Aeromicrobium sp.]